MMSTFLKTQRVMGQWNLGCYGPKALPVKPVQMIGCRCSQLFSCIAVIQLDSLHLHRSRRYQWHAQSMVDDGREPDSPASNSTSSTRLIRTLQSFLKRLVTRAQKFRKGLPMKVLFFLVGFYCATAFATVIGQTGDWDILSAGLAVVLVEGIGALMYRASFSFVDRLKSAVTVFNYWKAGLSLGLFLDAFKYEIDIKILDGCNPFDFEFDLFPFLW